MARRKYGFRIAGFVFKAICTLVILLVVGLLVWRIVDSKITPKEVKTLIPNDTLCEAYEKHGDKLTMYYQDQNEYTQRKGENENYGYFANEGTVFIKEAEQVQFILRYNNSTLKYTAERYMLESEPTREENAFDVSLVIMYDLTPDNDSDNDGKTPEAVEYMRIQPTFDPLKHQKTLYNYRKYIFDGVKIDDSVLAVYIDIYYAGEVDYDEQPYGTLMLYSYNEENITYKLSSSDKKALKDELE